MKANHLQKGTNFQFTHVQSKSTVGKLGVLEREKKTTHFNLLGLQNNMKSTPQAIYLNLVST